MYLLGSNIFMLLLALNVFGETLETKDIKLRQQRSDGLIPLLVNLLVDEKRERENMRQEFNASMETMKRLKSDLATLSFKVTNDITKQLNTVKGQLSTVKSGSAVAFYAWFSNDKHTIGYKQTIVYNNVVTNVGKGFNNKTGHFRAPVKGVYMFEVTSMGKSKIAVHLDIMKNGNRVGCVRSQNDPNLMSGSKVIVLELEASDTVWIQNGFGGSIRLHSHNGIYAFNTFSGFLIK